MSTVVVSSSVRNENREPSFNAYQYLKKKRTMKIFTIIVLESTVIFLAEGATCIHILGCVSIFCNFINGWRFTDGYIAAIRNLGLVRFRLAIYTLSCKNPAKVADTHFVHRKKL